MGIEWAEGTTLHTEEIMRNNADTPADYSHVVARCD